MKKMSDRPLNFDDGSSKVIFSVLKRGATTGTTNYNKNILYQRYTYGIVSRARARSTRAAAARSAGRRTIRRPTPTPTRTSSSRTCRRLWSRRAG